MYLYIKRLQDIVLSILGLVVLFPVMLLISLFIVIDSPGANPLFIQTRVGINGKKFRFIKFRTMHPNAEAYLEQLMARMRWTAPYSRSRTTRVLPA